MIQDLAGRLAAQVRLSGVRGAAGVLGRQLLASVHSDDAHVWLELDPGQVPALPLRDGVTVRRGTEADLVRIDRIPPVSRHQGRARLRDGAQLWLALDGEEVLFLCWLLAGTAPALGLPGGALRLPPGVVDLEDSVTPPAHRGAGVAPGALCRVLAVAAGSGVTSVVTRIAVDNTSSLRAAAKLGFREVVTVTVRRRGRRRHCAVSPAPGREQGWLVAAFRLAEG